MKRVLLWLPACRLDWNRWYHAVHRSTT
jgi:hypothetical protein